MTDVNLSSVVGGRDRAAHTAFSLISIAASDKSIADAFNLADAQDAWVELAGLYGQSITSKNYSELEASAVDRGKVAEAGLARAMFVAGGSAKAAICGGTTEDIAVSGSTVTQSADTTTWTAAPRGLGMDLTESFFALGSTDNNTVYILRASTPGDLSTLSLYDSIAIDYAGDEGPRGIYLSPDGLWLLVMSRRSSGGTPDDMRVYNTPTPFKFTDGIQTEKVDLQPTVDNPWGITMSPDLLNLYIGPEANSNIARVKLVAPMDFSDLSAVTTASAGDTDITAICWTASGDSHVMASTSDIFGYTADPAYEVSGRSYNSQTTAFAGREGFAMPPLGGVAYQVNRTSDLIEKIQF
jgi:hypothetical protein